MAQYNFLVKSGSSTKPITLDYNDVQSVTDEIRKKFDVPVDSTIKLQTYSAEWDDYVDVEIENDDAEPTIQNKSKINVLASVDVDLQSLFEQNQCPGRESTCSTLGSLFSSPSTSTSDEASVNNQYVYSIL